MSVYLDDGDAVLHHGDALATLQTMPSSSVHCIVTSPPFWALRDYGVDGQIGLEGSPSEWCAALVAVFREARRVLRPDGVAWIEVGDTYAGSWGAQGREGETPGISSRQISEAPRNASRTGAIPPGADFKPKDLVGAPWLLAKALRDPYYTGTISRTEDRVWLAAMLDAEGSINIHRRPAGTSNYAPYERKDGTTANYERKNDSFQPKVEISNTNPRIMARLVELAGGNSDTKQEAGTHGRKQTIYRWTLTADKARAFLREVYPHLVGKQQEARLGYGAPSSGDKATEAWTALKLLHAGSETTVDFPAPPSLYEAGWFLRSDIVWARLRPNPMPESVTDRPTKAHSYVFLLSREPRYFFDADAIREAAKRAGEAPGGNRAGVDEYKVNGGWAGGEVPAMANARSVWSIATEPTPFAHFATFPQALAARCILAGTSEHGCCTECGAPWTRTVERTPMQVAPSPKPAGWQASGDDHARTQVGGTMTKPPTSKTVGWAASCACNATVEPCTVLDPFAGSATTLLVARRHGRRSVGIELSAEYLAIAATRLQQLSLLGGDAA